MSIGRVANGYELDTHHGILVLVVGHQRDLTVDVELFEEIATNAKDLERQLRLRRAM